jgi:hypothetical protein
MKKTIFCLTTGVTARILTERPRGPIHRPLLGAPTPTSTPLRVRTRLQSDSVRLPAMSTSTS